METPKSLLEAVEPAVVRGRGARFEADIMFLLWQDWFVLRSFEFAAVDAALVAAWSEPRPEPTSFAARYMYFSQLLNAQPDSVELIPFDVKSSAGRVGSSQAYAKSVGQHGEAAFFIGVSAADPNYVELIPNNPTTPDTDCHSRDLAANQTHKTFLDADTAAYGALNPCGSPYRMPLGYLRRAVALVRRCAMTGEAYVNPWTRVPFVGWRPRLMRSMESMAPAASTQHYSGYLGISRLWRHLENARLLRNIPIALDFVGLQPRLADLKLVLGQREVLVQYKIDSADRARGNFAGVAISREGRPFFSSHDRFDFLLYEFSSVSNGTAVRRVFFLVPERRLPTHFYTAEAGGKVDFSRLGLGEYLVEMDSAGDWVRRAVEIVEREPRPRRGAAMPLRASELLRPVATACRSRLEALFDDGAVRPPPTPRPSTFQQELAAFRRTLFYVVMAQCSQRLSGLLVLLADEHPDGDFAFCAYRWSRRERDIYAATGRPPKVIHELPACTPAVTLYAFARSMPCTPRGPILSAAEFRRIDSSPRPRLLVVDPMGPEGRAALGTLLVVPTEDVSADVEQRQKYKTSLAKDHHKGQFAKRPPLLASMLHSGRAITDYALSGGGPTAFDGTDWSQLWELLHSLTGTGPAHHPAHCARDPTRYRCSVQHLNTRLLAEMTKPGAAPLAGGPNVGPW